MASRSKEQLDIVLLEPFLTGSHKTWAEELARYSRHKVTILGLDGRYWKWRMHGGAVTLAERYTTLAALPDLILASDMLDLSTFLALSRSQTATIPTVLYFHENQLTYPWSPNDADVPLRRDSHYAFINYTGALVADQVLFNSHYHRDAFLTELPAFLAGFPDYSLTDSVAKIAAKSRALPVGLDLQLLDRLKPESCSGSDKPIILWNHRWEYDKNPEEFFQILYRLADQGAQFHLVVLGESYRNSPKIFAEAKKHLEQHIIHWGYVDSREDYISWLWRADYLPVTSFHDFFGISVVEAIYCGCFPLLPKRMAYPEHLPPELLDTYCYLNNDDLVSRLKILLGDRQTAPPESLRKKVAGYDWGNMIYDYDALFEGLTGLT